jgi:glutamine amidotransferase
VTRIAVIDHGAGNLVSMEQALVRAGATPERVTRGVDLRAYDGVVLPGVGATGPAMRTLDRTGLTDAILAFDGPLLAVCVGMQLLFDESREDDTRCLGLIAGTVERLDARPLPHMGWNDVSHDGASPFDGTAPSTPFYFVHSFAPVPVDTSTILGTTEYRGRPFVSAVRRDRITGLQFHPERSGDAGIRVLASFVASCGESARAA